MNNKAQAAVEFLTVYGWAILLVIITLTFIYYYGAFDPLKFIQKQCNFEPGFGCSTYKFEQVNSTTMKLTLQFYNNLEYDIAFQGNSTILKTENLGKKGKANYTGNCMPNYPAGIVKAGQLATCVYYITDTEIIPTLGKNLILKLETNYTNCNADPNYLTTGSCSGTDYKTAGNLVTPMESYVAPFYFCGDNNCTAGENPNNCPADCQPPAIILITASPQLVSPNGVQPSVIKVTLLNSTGGVMPNMEVSFVSIPIGKLNSYSNTTNSSGEATVLLTSTQSGVAKITAYSGGISNETTVAFKVMPAVLLLGAYDTYLGVCGGRSYIIATVKDTGNNPVSGVTVNFSHNATGTSTITPQYGLTDVTGLTVSYFNDTKVERVNITARVDLDEFGVHLRNSTVVEVVNCQACNAPLYGDWIIDRKVVCENKIINLNGDLNISISIGYMQDYMQEWKGDLTFKNVTLRMSLASDGQFGIYVNKDGEFHIFDNDNNPATTNDRSSIISANDKRYPFIIAPNAARFEMYNSYMSYCGYNTTLLNQSPWDRNVNGLFIQIDSAVIINNTIEAGFVGISLYNSKNHTVYNNTITKTAADRSVMPLFLNMVNNSNITRNYMFANVGGFPVVGNLPVLMLSGSSNNTVEDNTLQGDIKRRDTDPGYFVYVAPAGVRLQQSTNNTIINNRIAKTAPAVDIQSSTYNNITGNNGTDSVSSAFEVTASNYNTFLTNKITTYSNFGQDGVSVRNSNYNKFLNNYITTYPAGCTMCMELEVDSSFHNNFTNNIFLGGSPSPAKFTQSSNNTVFNTNFTYDIFVFNSQVNLINNGVRLHRIYLNSSSANITGHNIEGFYGSIGIEVRNSVVNITGNTIQTFDYVGIYLLNSRGTIEGNYIVPTTVPQYEVGNRYGIFLENSSYVDITSNTIRNTNISGIYFYKSNSTAWLNTITGGGTAYSRFGVYCDTSTTSRPALYGNAISLVGSPLDSCPTQNITVPISLCGTITMNSTPTIDLTNSSTCITFGADNIMLDCNGHSITRIPGGSGEAYGVYANSKKNIVIKNCVVKNYTRNIRLENTTFSTVTKNNVSLGVYGVYLNSSSNNTLSNNNAFNNTSYGFYLNSSSTNNTISNSTFSLNVYGIALDSSSNNIIINNNVSSGTYGVLLSKSSNNNISKNRVYNNTSNIVVKSRSNMNKIDTNSIYDTSTGTGIRIDTSSSNTVSNSSIYNTYYGLYLYGGLGSAGNNNVTNNTIRNNVYGIYSNAFYEGGNIRNNTISSNTNTGIYFSLSNQLVEKNTIVSNTQYGVYCINTYYHPTFSQNSISSNGNNCDDCISCCGCPG